MGEPWCFYDRSNEGGKTKESMGRTPDLLAKNWPS